jgi:hypothetical protein
MLQNIQDSHFHEYDGFVSDEVDSVNGSSTGINSLPSSRSLTPLPYCTLKGSSGEGPDDCSQLIVIPGDDSYQGSTTCHLNHICCNKSDVSACASEACRSKTGELDPKDLNVLQIAHIDYSGSPNDVWRSIQRRSSKHSRFFLDEFLSPLYHPECKQKKHPRASFSPSEICENLLSKGGNHCPHSSFPFKFHSYFSCPKRISVSPAVPCFSTRRLLTHASCARAVAYGEPLDHVVYKPSRKKRHRIQDFHLTEDVRCKIIGTKTILNDGMRRNAIDDGTLEIAFILSALSSDVYNSDNKLRSFPFKSAAFLPHSASINLNEDELKS